MAADLYAALAAIPLFAGVPPERIVWRPLQGLSNRNYQVCLDGRCYVLRLSATGTAVDRERERVNLGQVAMAGLAPPVRYHDPARGVLVTDFVGRGEALTARAMRGSAMLVQVAQLLRRLHQSSLPFTGHQTLFEAIDGGASTLAGAASPLRERLRALYKDAQPYRRMLDANRPQWVPSHVDPNPANFVHTDCRARGALLLVDWEHAALAEPAWDLACLSVEAALNPYQDRTLLAAYAGGDTTVDLRRFAVHQALLELLGALWGAAQLAADNPAADFLDYTRCRADRAGQRLTGLRACPAG